MNYSEIKKRYNYLSSADLVKEIKERSTKRNGSWMISAADCGLNSDIIRACKEILIERNI